MNTILFLIILGVGMWVTFIMGIEYGKETEKENQSKIENDEFRKKVGWR